MNESMNYEDGGREMGALSRMQADIDVILKDIEHLIDDNPATTEGDPIHHIDIDEILSEKQEVAYERAARRKSVARRLYAAYKPKPAAPEPAARTAAKVVVAPPQKLRRAVEEYERGISQRGGRSVFRTLFRRFEY